MLRDLKNPESCATKDFNLSAGLVLSKSNDVGERHRQPEPGTIRSEAEQQRQELQKCKESLKPKSLQNPVPPTPLPHPILYPVLYAILYPVPYPIPHPIPATPKEADTLKPCPRSKGVVNPLVPSQEPVLETLIVPLP